MSKSRITNGRLPLGKIINIHFGTRITRANNIGTKYPVYGGGGESFRTDEYNRNDDFVIARYAISENCVRHVKGKFFLLDSGMSFSVAPDFVNSVDKEYIGRFLLSAQQAIYATARGQGQKNIDMKMFLRISGPILPSLDEQKRIVELLDKQMTAAEQAMVAANEQLEAIEAMPAALLRQAFGDLSTPPPPYWKLLKMREIFLFNASKPKKFFRLDNSQTTFIPMKSVSGISGEAVSPQTVPYAKVKRGYTFFMEGDILFAKITPCMQNGKHFIAKKLIDKIGFGSTEFHVLRPTEKILAEWGHFFLRQEHILKRAVNYFIGSVGQQRLPQTFLENLLIPVPPLDEQKRIINRLKKQMAEVDAMRLAAQESANATQVMPAALLRQTFGEPS